MKKFKKLLLILLMLPCIFLFNACSFFADEKVYVTEIIKTETVGNEDTYTIYFSDGTSSMLTVQNGENGESLTIENIKEYCTTNDIDFDSFLKQYLTVVQNVESEEKTVQTATNIAIHSTVSIWCEFPTTSNYYGQDTDVCCGAGVIYKMEETYSYIITNYHVVYMYGCDTSTDIAKEIHIFQYGTSEKAYRVTTEDEYGNTVAKLDADGYPEITYGYGAIEATYIGGELVYDLAVLRVPTEELLNYNLNAKAVTVAESYDLGETAIAIGNPEGAGTSVTSGIISVLSEDLTIYGADDRTECTFRVLRIDAAVNGGNSGGGLFDIDGSLIGIVNAKVIASDIDNIAYAIPFDNVIPVVDNILYYYQTTGTISGVKKFELGIGYTVANSHPVVDESTGLITIEDDLVITSVENSILHFQVGDIIRSISINGEVYTIKRAYQLPDLLLTIRAGDKIIVKFEREGEEELQSAGIADSNGVLASYIKDVA